MMEGKSGIRLMPPEQSNNRPTVAGMVDFDPGIHLLGVKLTALDRVSQLAVFAASQALGSSDLIIPDPYRIGCYVGCGMGGAGSIDEAMACHYLSTSKVSPLCVVAGMTNAAAAHVAMHLGTRGPVLTYAVACASSGVAIGEAFRAIQYGSVDYAIVGGTEALLTAGFVHAWQAMRTLARVDPDHAERSCWPFSANRSGLVLAEGAAFMLLERSDQAKARGATVYANLLGYGTTCDASHIAKPDAAGQVRAIEDALRDAKLNPADIGYLNAHGTATQVGDVVESNTINQVWGADIDKLKVSSTKSMHGHLLGAAGAMEAVVTVLSLHQRKIPPTAFCNEPDVEISLPLVLDKGIDAPDLRFAMSNSFAFGGSNAVLVFGAAEN